MGGSTYNGKQLSRTGMSPTVPFLQKKDIRENRNLSTLSLECLSAAPVLLVSTIRRFFQILLCKQNQTSPPARGLGS